MLTSLSHKAVVADIPLAELRLSNVQTIPFQDQLAWPLSIQQMY